MMLSLATGGFVGSAMGGSFNQRLAALSSPQYSRNSCACRALVDLGALHHGLHARTPPDEFRLPDFVTASAP
jgi:hypothetical protein